jgi:glycosyltransferase involved in cell wall biosynthesis
MKDTRKKVLFMTSGFFPGGAETLLINILNSLNTERIDPIAVSLGELQKLEEHLRKDIPLHHFLRRFRFDLGPSVKIAQLLRNESIGSVLVFGFFCYFFVLLAMRKNKETLPTFVSLHSTQPRSFKHHLQNIAYSRLVKDNTTLIAVCRTQAEYLSARYRLPLSQFKIIYNGVDTNYWTIPQDLSERSGLREKLGIPSDSPVVVQAAMFRSEKRHDDSVRALAWLHGNSSLKPYLLFVGGGDERLIHRAHQLAVKERIRDYVKFAGYQIDVRPYYWISDLFTLSSESIETFSIAALEALSTGLPCVLTDVGGAREMIVAGQNGYIVPKRDPEAMAKAWLLVLERAGNFSREMIREQVKGRFSITQCVRNYEKILLGQPTIV